MSVELTPKFSPNAVSVDPIQPFELFPAEIWHKVISHLINDSTSLNHLVNYMLVSKEFCSFCIEHVKRYQWLLVFKNLKPLVEEIAPQTLKDVLPFVSDRPLTMLNHAKKGKSYQQYMRQQYKDEESTLYILDASERGFVMAILNIEKEIQTKFGDTLKQHQLSNYAWYHIVNCHPTDTGFILVTTFGVSRWQYNAHSQPECIGFYLPNCDGIKGNYRFIASTYIQNELYINCWHRMATILIATFTDHSVAFVSLKDQVFSKKETELSELISFRNRYYKIDNWLVFQKRQNMVDYLCLLDENDFTIAIDEQLNIVMPKPGYHEYLCIMNDFIFLFYSDQTCRILHIPTKTELTKQLDPFLKPYLQPDVFVFAVHFYKKSHQVVLQILLKTQHQATHFSFKSIEIPLSLSLTSPEKPTNDNAK